MSCLVKTTVYTGSLVFSHLVFLSYQSRSRTQLTEKLARDAETFEIKNVVWQPCRVSVNHYGQWTWWLALLCTNITSKEGVQPMRLYKRRKTHRNQNSFITNLQMFRHRLANWLVVLCLLTTYIIGSSGHPYSYIDEVLYASSLWNYLWQTSHSHGAVIPGLQPIGGIGLNSLKGIGSMLLSLIRVLTNT